MNPWEILGLSEDCRDKKEIRKAYASLIRIHRPDKDPEKFREIRDAYESILNVLAFEEHYQTELNTVDINNPEEEGLQLSDTIETEGPQSEEPSANVEEQAVGPEIDIPDISIAEANELFLNNNLEVEVWQALVEQRADGDTDVLIRDIGNTELFKELDSDSALIISKIIDDRVKHGEYELLEEFAVQWKDRIDSIALMNAGHFTLWLVTRLAFAKLVLARELFTLAFEYLGAGESQSWTVFMADRYLRAASDVQYQSIGVRRHMATILISGEWDENPISIQNRKTFDTLCGVYADSDVRALFLETVPSFMEAADEYCRDGSKSPGRSRADTAYEVYRSEKKYEESNIEFPWWTIFIAVIIAMNAARSCNYDTYNPPRFHNEIKLDLENDEYFKDLQKKWKENPDDFLKELNENINKNKQ